MTLFINSYKSIFVIKDFMILYFIYQSELIYKNLILNLQKFVIFMEL